MNAQASVLTSEFRRDAPSSGPRPQRKQSRGCPQGTGCATGRGQGGDITLSFLVTWALDRTPVFVDRSELRVGSVEMRTKQETGGAGNETDGSLHGSLDHSASPTKSWAPAALGPCGSPTSRRPQRTELKPSPQGCYPRRDGFSNDRMALSLRSSGLGLESPLPAALTTHQAKLQVFFDQNFHKSLLLFVQKH